MRDGIERRLFVAATSQNDGKTTCSLGFVKGFSGIAKSVGFIKPVGQRYVTVDNQQIDEDSLLVRQAFDQQCPLKDMNPICVSQHFTRDFLDNPDLLYPSLEKAIHNSFAITAEDNDLVVIEGTGHAGVGSVFGLSNAHVAGLLHAKAIIVTLGGIGRPVDEIAVNKSLFEKEGVPVIGVVVNKVLPDKLEQTAQYLRKAFARLDIPLLGVIPYAPRLAWPTVQQVTEALKAKVLNGQHRLGNLIVNTIIGAMSPHNALSYLQNKTLLIVPGDRDDMLLAAVSMDLLKPDLELAGIVLTGGLMPQPQTMDLVKRTDIPVLYVDAGTYESATRIRDTVVKIRAKDDDKVQLATALVRDYVDLGQLWCCLE